MNQEKILQFLAGAGQVIRESSDMITNNGAEFIDKKVIKGKYVTREEHDQLKKIVLKLEEEILNLKAKTESVIK